MGLYVSTTGTNVVIPELGITIVHPATDQDLSSQFDPEDLRNATSLTSVIRAGTLVWRKSAGGSAEPPTDYDADFADLEAENQGDGNIDDRAVLFKNLRSDVRIPPEFITTTANGSTSLTGDSTLCQFITGSASGYSIVLPDATFIPVGWKYEFFNISSKPVSLKDYTGAVVFKIDPQSWAFARLRVNGSASGTWFVNQNRKENFSYRRVDPERYIEIPDEQQMLSYQEVSIEDTGELAVEGEMVIVN